MDTMEKRITNVIKAILHILNMTEMHLKVPRESPMCKGKHNSQVIQCDEVSEAPAWPYTRLCQQEMQLGQGPSIRAKRSVQEVP